jgi:ATP-binding cassette subfamily C (CFTR/MRP) protein 1
MSEPIPNIEESSSWFSWTFMIYLDKLFSVGNVRTLELNDLGQISTQDKTELLYEKFTKFYEEESKKPIHKRSLWIPLLKTVGYGKIFVALIFFMISAGVQIGPVLILKRLVRHFEGIQEYTREQVWIMVALLFIFPMVSSLTLAHSNIIMSHGGCQARNTLVNVIYRKSLLVSPYSRQLVGSGKIITMFSDDTNQIRSFFYFMCNSICAPLQIGACLYLIYQEVGVATFVGLGYSIFVVPIGGAAFGYVAKLIREKMTFTDSRVKLMNEILTGIRIIKYYAWEKPFLKKISEIRDIEVQFLYKMGYIFNGVFAVFLLGAPQIQTVLIFFTYISLNHPLDAAVAFTTLTLFGLMMSPFIFLPYGLQQYSQSRVAMTRIIGFLESNNIENYITPITDESAKTILEFSNASLSWSPITEDENEDIKDNKTTKAKTEKTKDVKYQEVVVDEKEAEEACNENVNKATNTLSHLDIKIQKGQLVGVVGTVGSG